MLRVFNVRINDYNCVHMKPDGIPCVRIKLAGVVNNLGEKVVSL